MGCLNAKEAFNYHVDKPENADKPEKVDKKFDVDTLPNEPKKAVRMTSKWKLSVADENKKMYDFDNHFGHLVHGFIIQYIDGYVQIPPDVHNLIWLYIPKRVKFEWYDNKKWKLSDCGYILTGRDSYDESEFNNVHQLYAEPLNKHGMNTGIHYLSIKTTGSTIRLGIETYEQYAATKEGINTKDGLSYYFSPYTKEIDCIFSIRLDCNDWNVCYYSNSKLLYNQSIDQSSYYFGINARSYNDNILTIVDPNDIKFKFQIPKLGNSDFRTISEVNTSLNIDKPNVTKSMKKLNHRKVVVKKEIESLEF
eukprot:53011_1